MQRYEFCKDAKCARLIVTLEGSQPITLISRSPTLILEIEELEQEYTHRMNNPIEKNFPFLINGVESMGGKWRFNDISGPGQSPDLACPMPGTYPILVASDVTQDQITDLYWKDGNLYCYFDREDAYYNDTGRCSYKILGLGRHRFFDKQGTLYEVKPLKKLTYEVKCNDCCKDTEILCESNFFPGYGCYPIPPTAGRLLKGQNEIARYWRHRG